MEWRIGLERRVELEGRVELEQRVELELFELEWVTGWRDQKIFLLEVNSRAQ